VSELQHDSGIKEEQVTEYLGAIDEEGESKPLLLPVLRVEGQVIHV